VPHTCNTSFLGGWDWKSPGSRPADGGEAALGSGDTISSHGWAQVWGVEDIRRRMVMQVSLGKNMRPYVTSNQAEQKGPEA
jgi:hypothetical protein